MPSEINKKKKSYDPKRNLIGREIVLTSEFEGGNGIDFKEYGDNIFSFMPIRDPGEKYSGQAYYFKFAVENKLIRSDAIKHITVTAIADYDDLWKGWAPGLNINLWKYSGSSLVHLDPKNVKTTPKTMGINLILQPKEKIFISNMLSIPYSEMVNILEDIQLMYPTFLKLVEVGRSPMDKIIYSIRVNPDENHWKDTTKSKIIISGTPQSNEFGDYSTILLLQKFLKMGAEYWDSLLIFRIEFIFFQNPDGIVLGKNMVNSRGENIFFGFKDSKEKISVENTIVWDYLEKDPPTLYLEWHNFFQDRKTIRPYLYPIELFNSRKNLQKIYKKMATTLKSYCNGAKEQIKIDQQYFSDTLAYQLQKKFNTLSFQFKTHNSMEIKDIEAVIWDVFNKLIKILSRYNDKLL